MASVLYITLLDQFHPGIYSSQVIDVCDYLNKNYNVKIKLVAFLSLRELIKTNARKEIKKLFPSAIVLPAFPKIQFFELTALLLFFVCIFTGYKKAICRNIFCTSMALSLKNIGVLKKVILDGRSAMAAEIKEYDVFPVNYIRNNIEKFERNAVLKADFRIAVSNKLIEYWQNNYNYNSKNHVIIPCTLDNKYFKQINFNSSEKIISIKKELEINENDIVLVYAGSTAPWQSFKLLEKLIIPLMKNERIKLLFLSKLNDDIERLQKTFRNRVIVKWLPHNEVLDYLTCCDYGILLREQSVTNKVASPTKFGEYLYAGLPVLISENLGDFTEFTLKHQCGIVVNENSNFTIPENKPSIENKIRYRELAENYFYKESKINSDSYFKLTSELKN